MAKAKGKRKPADTSIRDTGIYRKNIHDLGEVNDDDDDMPADDAERDQRARQTIESARQRIDPEQWISAAETKARQVQDDPHSSEDEREEASSVLHWSKCLREARQRGEVDQVAFSAWRLGVHADRLHVRPFEALVFRVKGEYVNFNGRWVKIRDKRRRFLEYLSGLSEANIDDLYEYVWGGRFRRVQDGTTADRRKGDRGKVDTMKTRVNETLDKYEVRARFRVEGDRVVVDRW